MKKANEFIDLENIRKAFTKCTNTTWDEATEQFPWYTCSEKLSQFLGLNFMENVPDTFCSHYQPDTFCSYCQSALHTEHHQEYTSIIYQGSKAAALRKGLKYLAIVGNTDDVAAVRKKTTMLRNIVTKSTLPQDAEFEIEED